MALGGFVVLHGDADRFAGADEDDQLFGAGDGRIQQIPLQHQIMLGGHRHHHARILRALALMDRNGERMDQFVHFQKVVHHRRAVDADGEGLLQNIHARHAANVAVVDVFIVVVYRLHHLVAHAEQPPAQLALRLALHTRIKRFLQQQVEIAHAHRAVVHGRQHLDVVQRIQLKLKRRPVFHHVHQQFGRFVWRFLDEEEKIFGLWRGLWHFAFVDEVGVADDE